MADITIPVITDTVDQRWFIEPLSGPTPPGNYLDRFPEEVYNKSVDSHLVRFLYTLLGPAGIGWLKKDLLDARTALAEHGVELFDIERYYGDPFSFGRILSEIYDVDPTGTLPRSEWDTIKAQDESYRTRAIDYLKGARLGNSPAGMALVAQSGLGHAVAIIENYRHIFDTHADDPLGLRNYGRSASTEEFIVIPRQEVSRTEIHEISFSGDPSGNFAVSLGGQLSDVVSYDVPAGNVTYAELGNNGAGDPCIRILGPAPPDQPVVGTIMGYSVRPHPGTASISLAFDFNLYNPVTSTYTTTTPEDYGPHPSTEIQAFVDDINAGSTVFSAVFLRNGTITGSSVAVGQSTIGFSGRGLQNVLEQMPNIGEGNVRVTGGPGPLTPYTITFAGNLTNQDLAEVGVINGLVGGSVQIAQTQSSLDPATEVITIDPRAQHNLQIALDNIKPVTGIPTVFNATGIRTPQEWNSVLASSEYQEVVRFVTGNPAVSWPAVNQTHWIEPFKEKEAPRVKDDRQHHYIGFHNVLNVSAYTDLALSDPSYEDDSSILARYRSEHIGRFAPEQNVIPFFRQYANATNIFSADRTLADYAEPLVVTTQDGGSNTSFINGIYPTDYARLPGVPAIKYKDDQFWASLERRPGESEYVELDLGSVQAVNFLSFEAIAKPISLSIAFDILDQSPRRSFIEVTPEPLSPFETDLHFDPLSLSPWHQLEYRFTDSLGQSPFTRFIRIALSRQATGLVNPDSPPYLFNEATQVQTPWSVEIRNLRVGRSVVG